MFKTAFLSLLFSGFAFANVVYSFSGQAETFSGITFAFSFETVAPDFIIADTFYVPTTQCSLQDVPWGGDALKPDCAHIIFYPQGNLPPLTSVPEITLSNAGYTVGYDWFFDPGAFDAPGVYLATGGWPGQLTVSTVPEPAPVCLGGLTTLALVLVGLLHKKSDLQGSRGRRAASSR